MKRRFDNNILGTVGTLYPRSPYQQARPRRPSNLFVKIEALQPLGLRQHRLALGVHRRRRTRTGKLKPGQTVVEATSGNTTGIGLAM